MKIILFNIVAVLSVLSFIFSGLLFYMHFAGEDPGMMLVFLMPLLLLGLLLGFGVFVLQRTQDLKLTKFSKWLYNLDVILSLLGVVALIYVFFAE